MSQEWIPRNDRGEPEPFSATMLLNVREVPVLLFALKSQIEKILDVTYYSPPNEDQVQSIKNVLSRTVSLFSAAWQIYEDLTEDFIIDEDEHDPHDLSEHEWDTIISFLSDSKITHEISEDTPCIICDHIKRGEL